MEGIKEAPIVKRALCAIVDFAIAFLFGLGVFTAMSAILTNVPSGKAIREEISTYYKDSGLYTIDETGNPVGNTKSINYQDHLNMLLHYYTVYIASECPEAGRADYDVYWFNVFVLGLDDEQSKFSYEQISSYPDPRPSGKTLFRYAKDDKGNNLYDTVGVPRDELYEDGDPSKPLLHDAKYQLLWYFYSDSKRNCDYNAGYDLSHRVFFTDAQYRYELHSTVIPLVVAVVTSSIIFFAVFPMIFKEGQTLGKKVFGFGVMSCDGYVANKGQMLLRQFPPIALGIIAFAFFSGLVALILMGVLLIASYILAVFSTNHRAIHDFVAYTFVADLKESVYYKNSAEEEAANRVIDEKIEHIEKNKPGEK
ncbi:MAG: RDD family protein [Bacilli bacterium]|nr:RDD family protein [Bacilli bacterium]